MPRIRIVDICTHENTVMLNPNKAKLPYNIKQISYLRTYMPVYPVLLCVSGWYPELVYIIVIFTQSTDLVVVFPNSTTKNMFFFSQELDKTLIRATFSPDYQRYSKI